MRVFYAPVARCIAMVAMLSVLVPAAFAQDLRAPLFQEADAAMQKARSARADILSPQHFAEAEKYYLRAETNLKKGRGIESIRADLKQVVLHVSRAVEATRLAEVTLTDALQARSDALEADPENYAAESWKTAELKFRAAARRLEDGNVNDAKKKSAEARSLYREVELEAIQANFLDEARALLKRAEQEKANRQAPKTFARAQELLAQAEKGLASDRYDTDLPRSLAREAKYEARHALYLAEVVRSIDKKSVSVEDMLLAAEKPLERIASSFDVVAQFDGGYERTTGAILERVERLEAEHGRVKFDLSERQRQVGALEKEVASLESKLGGVSDERVAMQRRMDAEEKVRAKFAQIERTFSREEARVMREGDDVIIRLVGLTFDVGKSVIDAGYFGLLTKTQNAIRVFPGSRIRVEGHTDSYGTDAANLKLSTERAQAVRQYLVANMGIDGAMIQAVGYGETRPVASNETRDGRARNRRIDVVITPNLERVSTR